MMLATDEYWDCGCEHYYIKPASQPYCPDCETHRDNQPDSIVNEVLAAGLAIQRFPKED